MKAIGMLLILLLAVGFVLAAEKAESAKPEMNATKNMTFGQCVSQAADIKNTCYANTSATRDACVDAAEKAGTDDSTCKQQYKQDKKQCKTEFKAAKKECGKIKHNWIDSLKVMFK